MMLLWKLKLRLSPGEIQADSEARALCLLF